MHQGDLVQHVLNKNNQFWFVLAKRSNDTLIVCDQRYTREIKFIFGWSHKIIKIGNDQDVKFAKLLLSKDYTQKEIIKWELGFQIL